MQTAPAGQVTLLLVPSHLLHAGLVDLRHQLLEVAVRALLQDSQQQQQQQHTQAIT
jgi:hypothetical protein